jgi:hypothetical protein
MVKLQMPQWAKYKGTEADLQKTVAAYLNMCGVLWMHAPNEIKAKPVYMAKRKAMGVKPGVPDVLIFEPRGTYNGLAIELKVGYNLPSEAQQQWLDDLEARGWFVKWSRSLDEVMYVIDTYLKIK